MTSEECEVFLFPIQVQNYNKCVIMQQDFNLIIRDIWEMGIFAELSPLVRFLRL